MAIRKSTVQVPVLYRAAAATLGAIDKEARTVELTFSSDYPVERWFGVEVLDHGPGADLSRLNSAAPLLREHDREQQIGVVENASIKDGRGRALVRFSRSPEGEAELNDVIDGIRRNVSFGYRVKEMKMTDSGDKVDKFRVTAWEAFEISIVSVAADPTVGVGRSEDSAEKFDATIEAEVSVIDNSHNKNMNRSFLPKSFFTPDATVITGGAAPALTEAERTEALNATRKGEGDRIREIYAIGRKFGADAEAEKAVTEGTSLDGFRAWVLDNKMSAPKPVQATNPNIGMSEREAAQFSLLRAVNQIAIRGELSGLEKEASEAARKHFRREIKPGAICLPNEVATLDLGRALGINTRAQNATTFSAGGATIQNQYGPMIEILDNASVLNSLGITFINGLVGDFILPQQTGGATAYWVSETGTLTDSQATFSQKTMTPHRCGATIPFTTQFLAQTSIGAEAFLRGELMKRLALLQDLAGLEGTGNAGQPLGLKNTSGINSTVTFGGAPVWTDIVEFETGIAADNANIGSMGFALSSATVGKWKTVLKDSVAGAGYLIRDGGTANGYSVARTNQITGNIAFFGVWSELVKASWAGMEFIVDPYTLKKSGQIEITVNEMVDFLVRQPLAFNKSTDSAAQ